MADRALLAGYPRHMDSEFVNTSSAPSRSALTICTLRSQWNDIHSYERDSRGSLARIRTVHCTCRQQNKTIVQHCRSMQQIFIVWDVTQYDCVTVISVHMFYNKSPIHKLRNYFATEKVYLSIWHIYLLLSISKYIGSIHNFKYLTCIYEIWLWNVYIDLLW